MGIGILSDSKRQLIFLEVDMLLMDVLLLGTIIVVGWGIAVVVIVCVLTQLVKLSRYLCELLGHIRIGLLFGCVVVVLTTPSASYATPTSTASTLMVLLLLFLDLGLVLSLLVFVSIVVIVVVGLRRFTV